MKEIKLPEYKRIKLDNGLKVFLMKYPALPVVHFRFVSGRGSVYDPIGKEGLSRITASLLKKGTKTYSAIELFDEIDFLGGEIGCYVGLDDAVIIGEFLSKNWEKGFDLFTDTILNPVFHQEEVNREKKRIYGEIVSRKDNPGTLVGLHFSKFLFKQHPYGRPISGTESSINTIDRKDIIEFYNNHYAPRNSILVVAGDFDENIILQKIDSSLSKWSLNRKEDVSVPKSISPKGINILIVDKPDATQTQIMLGNIGIERNNENYFAIRVMNNILGGGFNSRLNNEVRIKKGLTYSIYSRFNAFLFPGEFLIGTFTKNQTTLETIQIIIDELRKIKSEYVSEEELRGSQRYINGLFPLSIETIESMSKHITDIEFYGFNEKYIENYSKNILNVQIEDVKRVAQKYIHPDDLAIAVVGRMDDVKNDLKKLGNLVYKNYKDEV